MIDMQFIPRELQLPGEKKADLFKDFVDDGQLEIWLQCVAPGQYFGAAQADLYLRAAMARSLELHQGLPGHLAANVLVLALGVTFSTFSAGRWPWWPPWGPCWAGFFNDFMLRLATGQTYGGGPVRVDHPHPHPAEHDVAAWSRASHHRGPDARPGGRGGAARDGHGPARLRPFGFSEYVAAASISRRAPLLTFTCRAFAFVLPVLRGRLLCLKNREVAR